MSRSTQWHNRDFYAELGVSASATAKEITRAYRKLAKESHPDKHQGDASAEERFKRIAEAYEVLDDAGLRHEYDWLRSADQSATHAASGAAGARDDIPDWTPGYGPSRQPSTAPPPPPPSKGWRLFVQYRMVAAYGVGSLALAFVALAALGMFDSSSTVRRSLHIGDESSVIEAVIKTQDGGVVSQATCPHVRSGSTETITCQLTLRDGEHAAERVYLDHGSKTYGSIERKNPPAPL